MRIDTLKQLDALITKNKPQKILLDSESFEIAWRESYPINRTPSGSEVKYRGVVIVRHFSNTLDLTGDTPRWTEDGAKPVLLEDQPIMTP